MNSVNIVIYHANCADGKSAAAVAYKKLGSEKTYYIAANYGEDLLSKIEETLGQFDKELDNVGTIYFLDFSPNKKFVEDFELSPIDIVVIDHHESTEIDDLGSVVDKYVYSKEKSGCVLAFEYFFPGRDVPYLLEIIQDRDLWKFKLPETKAFLAGYDPKKAGFTELVVMMHEGPDSGIMASLTDTGGAILSRIMASAATNTKRAVILPFMGMKVGVCNVVENISETGDKMSATIDIDFSMTYFVTEKAEVVFSLRSKEYDVGALAKSLGGGGHKLAAGFKRDLDYLKDLLNGKL